MEKGKVKWYDETKGFGFIVSDEGKEIFVHRSGLYSSFAGLDENEHVEYDVRVGERGPVAYNVKSAS